MTPRDWFQLGRDRSLQDPSWAQDRGHTSQQPGPMRVWSQVLLVCLWPEPWTLRDLSHLSWCLCGSAQSLGPEGSPLDTPSGAQGLLGPGVPSLHEASACSMAFPSPSQTQCARRWPIGPSTLLLRCPANLPDLSTQRPQCEGRAARLQRQLPTSYFSPPGLCFRICKLGMTVATLKSLSKLCQGSA